MAFGARAAMRGARAQELHPMVLMAIAPARLGKTEPEAAAALEQSEGSQRLGDWMTSHPHYRAVPFHERARPLPSG